MGVKKLSIILVFFLVSSSKPVTSANILGIFPMPSYSHYILGKALLNELAAKGNNITIISPYVEERKEQSENYHQIYLEGLANIIQAQKGEFFVMESMSPINQIILCYNLGYICSEFTLNYKPVKDLISSNATFDVVIMDLFFNEALTIIPYKFEAPIIYMSSFGAHTWSNRIVGNPTPLSYVPNKFLDYAGKMTYFQRLNNLLLSIMDNLYSRFVSAPSHNKLVQKAVPGAPELSDLLDKQDSLILDNSHVSVDNPTPRNPNIISVGGFHIKPASLLDQDLQEIFDKAEHGVIYFSLGSNLEATILSRQNRDILINTFKSLNQTVLCKWDGTDVSDKPKNVIFNKWLPQQAILAHPKTKGFISHGGLLSTTEAVYFGVPIIGIPIYGDQKLNVNIAVKRGFCVLVPFKTLSEDTLLEAIVRINENTTYLENAKKWSKIMHDRPIKPMEEAVYWVDYVIKHKGVSHLRTLAMDLNWYQYEMLDIIVPICLIFSAVFIYLFKNIFRRNTTQKLKYN